MQDGSFELQFVVYRNYNCNENTILQHSTWESKPENLQSFMSSIYPAGGLGREAIEIGFAHVNEEHKNTKVSQVILIGDMPPNTREEVTCHRNTYNYKSTSKFSKPTCYEDEMTLFIENNVPVHAFYVHDYAKEIFSKIAIATGGRCESLDIHSPAGAVMLTTLVTEYVFSFNYLFRIINS